MNYQFFVEFSRPVGFGLRSAAGCLGLALYFGWGAHCRVGGLIFVFRGFFASVGGVSGLVCVCVFTSIHLEGFICLGLEVQGTDQRCCVEDVIFPCQVPSTILQYESPSLSN